MPQASDELRALMKDWFGDDIDTSGPIRALTLRGYTLGEDFVWDPPTKSHTISWVEYQLIVFLMDEWDFGGIRPS